MESIGAGFWVLLIATRCAIAAACESGWIEYNGCCYFFENRGLQYQIAEQTCNVKGARLVVPRTVEENAWVSWQAAQKSFGTVWLGYRRYGASDLKNFFAADCGPGSLVYNKWNGGEPNNYGGNEPCAHMWLGSNTWNDIPCTYSYQSVCKKCPGVEPVCPYPNNTVCPADWHQFDSCCIGEFHVPSDWDTAKYVCSLYDAELQPVRCRDETNQLASLGLSYDYWIGFQRQERDTYTEFVNMAGVIPWYTDWAPGEPDIIPNVAQDCVQMWNSNGNRWDNLECSSNLKFLCRRCIGVDQMCPTTTTTTTTTKPCPDSLYIEHGESSASMRQPIRPGGVVNFTCNEGYHLSGMNQSRCTDHGYDTAFPICLRICNWPIITNGTLRSVEPSLPTLNGSTLLIVCEDNFFHNGSNATTLLCDQDGNPISPKEINCRPATEEEKRRWNWILLVIQKISCLLILVFLGLSMVLFNMFRVWHLERCLQLGTELSLFLAHIILIFFSEPYELPSHTLCNAASIGIQFSLILHFAMMLCESVQSFAMVTNIVNGRLLPKKIYFGSALATATTCTVATATFHAAEYHSYLSCWLNINHELKYGTATPLIVTGLLGMILAESAGIHGQDRLPRQDYFRNLASVVCQKFLPIKIFLSFVAWFFGSIALFTRNPFLVTFGSGLNISLGASVFFFHVSSDQNVLKYVTSKINTMKAKFRLKSAAPPTKIESMNANCETSFL